MTSPRRLAIGLCLLGALVNAVGHPNFQLMIDFYHLASEKEAGRVFPLDGNELDYAPFFANLRKIHYDKRISVEASTTDFPREAPLTIALLRRSFQP
jgi:sugar phosphate isomerase/epimerase